jgi:hypothetical protein
MERFSRMMVPPGPGAPKRTGLLGLKLVKWLAMPGTPGPGIPGTPDMNAICGSRLGTPDNPDMLDRPESPGTWTIVGYPGPGPGLAPGMGPGMGPGIGPGIGPGMGPGLTPALKAGLMLMLVGNTELTAGLKPAGTPALELLPGLGPRTGLL